MVACGIGYYEYATVKASTISENTISTSNATNINTNTTNTNTTNTNNLDNANTSGAEYKPNGNFYLSKFFGTWNLGGEIAHVVEGGNSKAPSGNKELILTKSLYSYNGIVINNPQYYVVTSPSESFFGSEGIEGNISNTFSFIVAVPQNVVVNKDYFFKNIEYNYNGPFITNGMLCGFGGPNDIQIYEFNRA